MKKILLWPLSRLYGVVVGARNRAYDREWLPIYKSTLPVICVGNISAGGNAKTPTCIFLAEELQKRGLKPVILLRGYGGTQTGPTIVTSESDAKKVGDEAKLFQQVLQISVVVAKDRVAGAKFIETQKLGDVVIIDDGFQHRRLARNVDIISVNVATPEAIDDFLKADLLPLGFFRENFTEALRRADIVIYSERSGGGKYRDPLDPRLLQILPQHVQVYRSFFEVTGISSIKDGSLLKEKRVVAFCGIANPQGFLRSLASSNLELASIKLFPDHHFFTPEDIQSIRSEFPNLPLVCTAKDAVKLTDVDTSGIYECRGKLTVLPSDAFVSQIIKAITSGSLSRPSLQVAR